MTNIHEFMKNRESSVTSVVDGKTIIDFFNQNADFSVFDMDSNDRTPSNASRRLNVLRAFEAFER